MVPSIRKHPIRKYFGRGLAVTVNTDDPKMFGNSLAAEYRCLEAEVDFSRDEIRALILQGIRATWLPQDTKEQLSESFRHDLAWHE
jgi:adenosine deaminase